MPYTLELASFSTPPLLRILFHGVMAKADLIAIADDVVALEARETAAGRRTPPRIVDLRAVERIDVQYPDMRELAERRRLSPPQTPIRSALVVGTQLQRGYARMFQTLNDHPMVSLEIFESEAAALEWLAAGTEQPDQDASGYSASS
jgi:hypothetical protein